MKTIKSILIAATLICASAVSTMSAQQAAPEQQHQFKVAIGDSVMIKTECQQYCTGERPSTWVWDKVHTVRQLGTKRFADGVLLMNIYSWMCEECLINVNGHAQESAEKAAVEQAADKQAAIDAGLVKPDPVKPTEPVKEEVVEQPKEEEIVPEEPAIVATDTVKHEPAKGDSVQSEQKFKNNYDRFTIGVRGGASSLMHHSNVGNWTCGGDVVLDLQYAHYWAKDGRPVDLGIITGIGIGYEQSGLKVGYDSTRFSRPSGAYNVDYTVVAKDIKETDHQLQLEVPLMFSLIHDSGLFFNVGPRFMIPVYSPYKQTVDQNGTSVAAYFEETGITVKDNPVIGQYTGQQPEAKNGIQFNVNVLLSAEIGYEWILKSGNSLGLGAYANYGWNLMYKNKPSGEGLFDLTPPSDTAKGQLDVLSATHAYADKLSFFDAGLKLAYHFNFPKKLKQVAPEEIVP